MQSKNSGKIGKSFKWLIKTEPKPIEDISTTFCESYIFSLNFYV